MDPETIAPARRSRRTAVILLTAAVALGGAVAATVLDARTSPGRLGDPAPPSGGRLGAAGAQLVSYRSCAGLQRDLRTAAARTVTAYGLPGGNSTIGAERAPVAGPVAAAGSAGPANAATPSAAPAGASSGTNDQEIGADEPDEVKTVDGRVVTLVGGVLRVLDAPTRRVTGTLDLSLYAGSDSAQLLVTGDRAVVVLGGDSGGTVRTSAGLPYQQSTGGGFLLVRLGGTPSVIGTFRPDGAYVGARLVDGTVRLVVTSTPRLAFPQPADGRGSVRTNRAIVGRAAVGAWLPRWTATDGSTTTPGQVGCADVAHPRATTGAAMTTIYTLDPARGFTNLEPVTVAAGADAVYATTRSLYLAETTDPSNTGDIVGPGGPVASGDARTDLYRFDISAPGRPRYVASGAVAGRLLSAYSLSDADGYLRVVTTSGQDGGASTTTLSVLDASTLHRVGRVSGLGTTEQVYAVRFVGDLGFVVTFRRTDPLHVLDLRDPTNPRLAGLLEIDGYSSYLHPVGSGRLLGVGSVVGADNEPSALQLSLFDVSRPAQPARLDRLVRHGTAGAGTEVDPHSVLYWPAARTAAVPLDSWDGRDAGSVLVVRVGTDRLRTLGTVRTPGDAADGAIERTFVVDGALWTLAPSGVLVSDLSTLHRDAWVPFS